MTLLPSTALAADTATPVLSAGTYLQAGLALILIIALLGATAWLARKLSGGKGFGQSNLKLLGGIALGPRERIILLEVGNEWLVIGIVPGQIRTLHHLEKSSSPTTTDSETMDKPFAEWLHGITNRKNHE